MASDESKNDISTNNGGGGAATPHRSKRINLGTPANYYFKYMNSSKKGESNESMISAKDAEGDNTGTISIPGFNLGGGGPATESSFLSLARSSVSGSDGSMDMLNKSTLSDTTELTASNFVLVTTSKQNMIRNSIHKKNHDAYKDKENPTKRKASDLKTQSDNPFGVNGSVGLSNQKKPFRHENVENGHEDNTAKAEKLAQGSDRRKDKEEVQEGGSHFVSMKSASPSLRSRISSSPGSLRKFQENLKNSRIQRQVQREEDTKRRLSIENKISLHSMDAQLEELTSEVIIKKRERLPPPFTQLTQKSLSQDSSIADDSLLLSPAQSNTGDSTSSINMADLDDILGIKSSTTRETRSSVTARYSSIQSLLGDDSCKECPSGDEQTETLSLLDKSSISTSAKPSAINDSEITNNDSGDVINRQQQGIGSPKSTSISRDVQPDYSSPKKTLPMALRSTTPQSRKKMTPSKLSSAAKRVINPQSIFSPASNTRSAKKRRKLDKEKQNSALSYMESIVDETKQPTEIDRPFSPGVSGNDRNISISLKFGSVDKLDQSGNDSESSSVNNNNNNNNDNDTASLGDVADLFGFITTDTNSPQNESHISLPMNGQTSQVRDDQETASIGEINEILNGFPSSQDSSSQDINVPRVLSQRGKDNDDGCTTTKQIAVNGPVEGTSQLRDDQETASIGDIDEILNGFPSSQDSSSQDINVPRVLSQRGKNSDGCTTTKQLAVDGPVEETNQLRDDQETASLGDIDEILNGFPSSQDSSSQETNVSRVFSQHGEDDDGCTTTKQSAEKNKLESFGQSLSMEKSKKIPESYAETSVSTKYLTTDVVNKSVDGEEPDETTLSVLEDVGKSPENISNLASINKGKDAISNGITSIGGVDLKSSIDALPTSPPTLNLPRMSPDHERSSSKSRDLNREELDHSVEMNLSRSFPKSPIRLIPNSHVKPTPTKLPPTPRRVLNPKNPNSPARNTRSSSKGKSPLSAGLFADLSAEERSSPTSATNHSVLPSSKYHHQSSTADSAPFCVRNIEYAIQSEEDHTRDHTRDNTRDSRPPIGILSCKKSKNTRRSVAFGSPEAAEYNIGSPSESFTPMPRGRAKALFSLPEIIRRTDGNQWDLNHKGIDVDDSNKMTVEQMNNSPELSPIAKSDTDAFQVPPEELSLMSLQGNSCHEERTVELEAGIEDMLANNLVKLTKENGLPESNASLSISQAEGRDNSIDLTDAESIVSIHSKCDKFTADFVLTKDAQKKLNFSFVPDVASECSSHCTEAEEGNTVELEGNIFSLLEAANKKTAVEDQETRDQMDMTGGLASITANSKIICRGKTVELEGNMLSLLKAAETKATGEDQETSDQMDTTEGSVSIIHGLEVEEGKTVELEGNMLSLLNAADTKATVDDQVTSEQIDMTGDSVSFIMANSQSISCDVETEGGKTVELEGNMFSLLEAAAETKTTEEGKGIILDQMDVTEDSVFMANDSIVGSSKNTTQDIKDEEGKTVELEGNMFSLLEAAAENKSEGEEKGTIDQMDMTADLVSVAVNATRGMDSQKSNQIDYLDEVDHKTTRRTRKSLSSSSFILNQVDETQISVSNIIAEHKSLILDKSVSFCDTKEFIANLTVECGSPNDHTEDLPIVDVDSFTTMLFNGLKCDEIQGDGLSECFLQFGKSNNNIDMIISEKWGQFIEAVCGEVERRTDLEGTAAASLSTLVEADPKFYSLFQKRFQSNEVGRSIEKFWNLVVEKGQKLVENEWNSWLAMVLESFHGPLNDVPNNFAHDASRLDEALQHCNMLQGKISLANDRKSTRARRKSFMRHQTVAIDLKGDVETIESQLAEMKSELDKIEREEANILMLKTDYHEMRLNAEEYNDLRVAAESAQKSSLSLRGLHSWSMGTVSGKYLEFITLGSCPQTHLKLLYEGNKSDKAQTRLSSSKVDSNHAKTKSLYVYHGPISVFLDSSVKRLMHTVQQRSSLEGSIRIGEHLQNYSWLLGRFDLIAREFQVVQRRYNGKLRRTHKDVDRFLVIVEFQNETSKIVVDFGIEPMMYPSFPVEIRLDLISGELDLDKLRKNLVKNAKPGFGSITRACDIVQSIIRG